MADYRRKKKNAGRQYDSGRRTSNYRRRPYTPRPSGLGGGGSYGGPRNYYRSHDFRYDRESETKPPKVETHYTIERPTETYRQPAYRPELDQVAVEKIVGQTIDTYRHNDLEHEKLEDNDQTQRHNENEIPIELQENIVEAKPPEEIGLAASQDMPSEVNLDLSAQPEPLSELSQEANTVIDKGPEFYDIPIADLELLLVELDANPLELRPERNIEAEPVREQ